MGAGGVFFLLDVQVAHVEFDRLIVVSRAVADEQEVAIVLADQLLIPLDHQLVL